MAQSGMRAAKNPNDGDPRGRASAPAPAYASFLLLVDPTSDVFRPKAIRCKCELSGNVLLGFSTRMGGGIAIATATDEAIEPFFVLKLAECIDIVAEPHVIEESVEKMRLRKKNSQHLAFRMLRHVVLSERSAQAQSRNRQGRFWPEQHAELVFKAEAGGHVNVWIKHLKRAMWWTRNRIIFHPTLSFADAESAPTNAVVKLLLDTALHPETAKTQANRSVDAHLKAESRNAFPRAIMLNVDDSTCTPVALKLQTQEQLGIAAYRLAIFNVADGRSVQPEHRPIGLLPIHRNQQSCRQYLFRLRYNKQPPGCLFTIETDTLRDHVRRA